MNKLTAQIVLTTLGFLVCVGEASAQTPIVNEEAKLLPADGSSYDYFGYSVSISGNRALIGVYGDDDNGSNSGSAYVFNFDGSTWQEEAKLLPSDGASHEKFGISAAISGDTLVVGAYTDDDNGVSSGSAYIYRFDGSTWQEEAKLLA
ncbi:MAG: FG-GAP repeat protein, partial [Phycisphaerales bacterium]|nr:FG-GAP repeat protein [Phycisphaerales bacterium]